MTLYVCNYVCMCAPEAAPATEAAPAPAPEAAPAPATEAASATPRAVVAMFDVFVMVLVLLLCCVCLLMF